ncbi:hypothetical protein EV384_3960 [Micromonospora kangleipakensis]|uniref:Uncharacterized protein n=1 Tax=Micromonospora kangleipakensis TaxID=1077942 RepID=A0A4Q8BE72_9ACTN|nr:hypothetical protein [Micromonospora kangleipakensis]RZU75419.1 hypothetical protein EV384_3960 [Micromonospora kangleipakensis]
MDVVHVLFDDRVSVEFHVFRLGGDVAAHAVGDGQGGQVNGLCGAAEPGALVFNTGLHTGYVPLRIERHVSEPLLDPVWTEVVEAFYTRTEPNVLLLTGDHRLTVRLELDQDTYRVRFCAIGYDNEDRVVDDPPERYLLQFWPAKAGPDRIVRQTSTVAANRHRVAQKTPPRPTYAERVDAARRQQEEKKRREREYFRARATHDWGGRLPDSDRLRQVGAWAKDVARVDRDLVDEIAAAEPAQQRAMAAWAARSAAIQAGAAELDWVAEALDALDRGDPPPPSFTDYRTALNRLWDVPEETAVHSFISSFIYSPTSIGKIELPAMEPQVQMVFAIVAAREEDPLVAALSTLKSALEIGPVDLAAFRAVFTQK